MNTVEKKVEQFFIEAFNYILIQEELDLKNKGIKDLTMVEIHVLEAVNKSSFKHDATMKEVADFLRISKGSLTVSSNRLITKGYLTKITDEFDRRKKYLKLTDEGKRICEIHDIWHKELTTQAIDGLNKNETEVLVNSLEKIMKILDKQNEQ